MSESKKPRWTFDEKKILQGLHLNPMEAVVLVEAIYSLLKASDKLSNFVMEIMSDKFGAIDTTKSPSPETTKSSPIDDLLRGFGGKENS